MPLKQTIARLRGAFAIPDEEAMRRLDVRDDLDAFQLLVERWRERIWQLCFRMQGNAATADDLVQETFARVYSNRHRFKPVAPFAAYLRRIALNLCYDELRRRERSATCSLDLLNPRETTPLVMAEPSPDRSAVQLEEGELVRHALTKLAPIYRTVIVLRHYEGLKLREVAALLEIPEGTVNSRLAEALLQLERHLRPQLGEDREPPKEAVRRTTVDRRIDYATSQT